MNDEERESLQQLRSDVEQLKTIMQPRRKPDEPAGVKPLAKERGLLKELVEMPSINFTRDAHEAAVEAKRRWRALHDDGGMTHML